VSARDVIFIRGLEARAILGVNDWERVEAQEVVLDLELACDAAVAAEEDDLERAVNYRTVAKAVLAHVEASSYFLIETLAERVAELVLRDFDVPWTRVRVTKPGAVRFSREVGVEIERGSRE
jgi:dihydroneopterin aldolase